MKQIVHVGYAHSPKDMRIFEKECTSLAKKPNYTVTYVTSTKSGVPVGEYTDHGVRIRILPLVDKRYVRLIHYLFDLKKELISLDADLYHFHEPWLLPVVAGALKRRGKPVIFDMHELYREQFMQRKGFIAKMIGRFYRRYERHVLPKLDAVIFPCKVLGLDPLEGIPLRRPTIYIDNTAITEDPDPEVRRKALEAVAERLSGFDPEGCPVTVYAGSLSETRGITPDVVGTARAGAKILLAGWFDSPEYKERLMSMPEWECATFVGKLTRPEVYALNERCDIGLATLLNVGQYYRIDNLPTKVHEYMQLGMPVIVSDTDFNKRLLKEYEFGIAVDPSDPDAIAEAIRRISSDPELAAKMSAEGKRAVRERFSWSNEEKKLFELYEELLGE